MKAPSLKPKSIAGRLLMFSGIFVTLALVVAAIVLWLALKTVVREQVDQRLDTQINALAAAVTRDTQGRITLSAPLDAPPFDRPSSGWYWQIDDGQQRLTSRSLMNGTIDAPLPRQDLRHVLMGMPTSGRGGDRGRGPLYLRLAIRSIDGMTLTITATAPMIALVGPALGALFWLVPCMLLLGLVLMAGTLWQIRFGLRPLKSMAANIDAVNRGERARLPDEATKELAPLALKTNTLLETNEERLAATRMQFANLAHGLKTPVASLLLALDEQNDPQGALRSLAARIDNRIKHHLAAARRVMASSDNVASTDLAAFGRRSPPRNQPDPRRAQHRLRHRYIKGPARCLRRKRCRGNARKPDRQRLQMGRLPRHPPRPPRRPNRPHHHRGRRSGHTAGSARCRAAAGCAGGRTRAGQRVWAEYRQRAGGIVWWVARARGEWGGGVAVCVVFAGGGAIGGIGFWV
ncbi:signal transduction histidine kinase [Rhizobium ruizarguesonis]